MVPLASWTVGFDASYECLEGSAMACAESEHARSQTEVEGILITCTGLNRSQSSQLESRSARLLYITPRTIGSLYVTPRTVESGYKLDW